MIQRHENGTLQVYYTVAELAKMRSISRGAVYKAIERGCLNATNLAGQLYVKMCDWSLYNLNKRSHDHIRLQGKRVYEPEKGVYSILQASRKISQTLGYPFTRQKIYYRIRTGEVKCEFIGSHVILKEEEINRICDIESKKEETA